MDELLIIDTRTASDGSFILFDNEVNYYLETFPELVAKNQRFTNAPLKTIEEIVKVFQQNPTTVHLSLSEIAHILQISMTTLSKRLKPLRKSGVITSIPFKFSDGSFHPKVTCEIVRFDHLNDSECNIEQVETNRTSNNKTIINDRKKDKQRLSVLGMNDVPTITKNKLPQVVSLQSNFLPNQLAATAPRPRGAKALALQEKKIFSEASRKLRIRNADGETMNVIAHIRSYSGIVDPSDLQVLYAIYSLTYHYHKNKSGNDGGKYERLTPINVHHIVALIGRVRSGPNTDYVRDCIQALEDTEYNLASLHSVDLVLDDVFKATYARDKFKNFDKCIPLTDDAPSIDDNGNAKLAKATYYLISLPENLFHRLMTDPTLFAFPQGSLSLHPILFSLYLRLRSTTFNNKFSERLHTTHKATSSTQSFFNFKTMLLTAVKGLVRSEKPHVSASHLHDETYAFNLFGFHGEITFDLEFIEGVCDYDEMLACCEVDRRNDVYRKNDTPTIFNELSLNVIQPIKALSTRHITTIAKTQKSFYAMKYSVLNATFPILINKFYNQETIEEIVDWMIDTSGVASERNIILERVMSDLASLSGLTINHSGKSILLTEDEVQKLVSYIGVIPIVTDMQKFMISLSRRRSLHGPIMKLLENDGNFNALDSNEQHLFETLLDDCDEQLGFIDRCAHLTF
ncbi:winged helix-turn-helix domain-containing protein (plasmid) [Vibrio scophthalmi]|uniref:winged helix-turn-helix domain-containing protein n=1 Tax=Vibrio scophthalmi TaxID=45658 RepID=UPI003EBF76AF